MGELSLKTTLIVALEKNYYEPAQRMNLILMHLLNFYYNQNMFDFFLNQIMIKKHQVIKINQVMFKKTQLISKKINIYLKIFKLQIKLFNTCL